MKIRLTISHPQVGYGSGWGTISNRMQPRDRPWRDMAFPLPFGRYLNVTIWRRVRSKQR